jgi:hypothetical protein
LVGKEFQGMVNSNLPSEKHDGNDFITKTTEVKQVYPDIATNQQATSNERTKEKVCCRRKLEGNFNPEASRLIKNMEQGR